MDALPLDLPLSPDVFYGGLAFILFLVGVSLGYWLRGRAMRPALDAAVVRHEAERDRLQSDVDRLDEARDRLESLLARSGEHRDRLQLERAQLAERVAGHEATESAQTARLREYARSHDILTSRLDSLRAENAELGSRLERDRAEAGEREKAQNEKLELLRQAEQRLTQQFQNLANRIFEDRSETFRTHSREHLEALLKPFREQVSSLHADVREASKERHTLQKEIERIVTEANSLTRALREDTRQQGAWGEFVLERLLEGSGLRKGREYVTQESHTSADGDRQRPDVIVHLPDDKDVIIDSKVSLKAFYRYRNADTDIEREQALRAHVGSLRQHIRQLAGKRYDALETVHSLDFTFMFVPMEPAYFAALQADENLVELAMTERIMIVSPTTLLAVLRTIDTLWRRERQNENAIRIADRAGRLYDKFVTFGETLERVGQSLDRAREQHASALRLLREGPGNVIRQMEMLREMGAATNKRLPDSLTGVPDESEAPEDPDAVWGPPR